MIDTLVLTDYLTLSGILICETGLRIGSSPDVIEIGGLDNPIIKHPLTDLPYVPGSSLKGKMRALLELRHNKIDTQPYQLDKETGEPKRDSKGKFLKNRDYGDVHKPGSQAGNCDGDNCLICRLFGANAGESTLGPTRFIVRDAYLTDKWRTEFKQKQDAGEPITEIKQENTINRITAEAKPRSMERVPAGVAFDFEIGYRIFDTGDGGQTDRTLFKHLLEGLRLVELDTLGGSGSRGYGKVQFRITSLTNFNDQDLLAGHQPAASKTAGFSVAEILNKLEAKSLPLPGSQPAAADG